MEHFKPSGEAESLLVIESYVEECVKNRREVSGLSCRSEDATLKEILAEHAPNISEGVFNLVKDAVSGAHSTGLAGWEAKTDQIALSLILLLSREQTLSGQNSLHRNQE